MAFQRITVKLGTSTLTGGSTCLSLPRIFDLVRQIVHLHKEGRQILLVTSGAVAAGREALNYPELPKFIPAKQMLSAVGQPRLMAIYDQFLRMFGVPMAQVLLTREDLADRNRYLNARNTMQGLLTQHIIPIINENDTIATEEIRLGDNDNLSALVANLVESDLLVLLTDQTGLFDRDPRQDTSARLIHSITTPDIPPEIWQAAGGTVTGLGTGGMITKLRAADLARRSGTMVVIASGSETDILLRVVRGEDIGTTFHPVVSTLESRKRYMLAGMRTSKETVLVIDKGAAQAIRRGGSLLPVGVLESSGQFERGDTVRILTQTGKDLALGLVNYSDRDLQIIRRRHSSEIEELLGYTFGEEVVHHNNMMLLKNESTWGSEETMRTCEAPPGAGLEK